MNNLRDMYNNATIYLDYLQDKHYPQFHHIPNLHNNLEEYSSLKYDPF